MNPFPDTLIVPTTSNRLPVTEKNEALIQKLLELEVDAATFLIPDDELDPTNNAQIARDDLMRQLKELPPALRDQIFPPKPTPPTIAPLPMTATTSSASDNSSDGRGGLGLGMSISPRLDYAELERARQRQQQRRQSSGPRMSM